VFDIHEITYTVVFVTERVVAVVLLGDTKLDTDMVLVLPMFWAV
jgi:hypothetical protein